MMLYVNAIRVREEKKGVFAIELGERELSSEERRFLYQLFPNLIDRAYELLAQEALIEALATRDQVKQLDQEKEAEMNLGNKKMNFEKSDDTRYN